MAHLREIAKRLCHRCNHNVAVFELYSNINARYGDYCKPCGSVRLKELEAAEAELRTGATSREASR